ncbi:hypothetical protein pqer_cds_1077 [Pandoravirus quercus]|uniref:Uncharacterized protein n=2 Tax=Pandoravirus TaxID=2060084 RepID=A0A2U7UAP1_9VIRU|nr:hypothetical protein pqer_cds_1077 [Pandoravirus quercus]AVK75499.1 hypothetical protein pqer_cds_1077 [Pandoravirus quercus]QBZ81679.1 hypothetical protein pclt_cds_1096 [Pandoravirus celtis]
MKPMRSFFLDVMHVPQAPTVALFVGLLMMTALVAAADPTPTPTPSLDRACEMVLDGATCQQRCECEWCPPGPDHGCHMINLAGACGGAPGQRAPHDACYDDPAAGVEGLVVGAVFVGLALVAVGLWWGCVCVRSLRRRFLRLGDCASAVDHETGASKGDPSIDHAPGEQPDHASQCDGPAAVPPRRPASRPIDMPRPRAPVPSSVYAPQQYQ